MDKIRLATADDFDTILAVINDGAEAYRGVIPADRWQEPYMDAAHLRGQMDEGVAFVCYERDGDLIGVMGVQDKGEVQLIRHAYVRTAERGTGIGSTLLAQCLSRIDTPVLIGTWRAADRAIRFYQKHGFHLVPEAEIAPLLHRYWNIPARQVETSVVLSNR